MSVFRSVSKCVLPSVHRASSVPAALMGGAALDPTTDATVGGLPISQLTTDGTISSSAGRMFLMDGLPIICSGELTQIKLKNGSATTCKLSVWRSGSKIWQSATINLTINADNTVAISETVSVQPDDLLGIWIPASAKTFQYKAFTGVTLRYATDADGSLSTVDSLSTSAAATAIFLEAIAVKPMLAVVGDSIVEGHNTASPWHAPFHTTTQGGTITVQPGYVAAKTKGWGYRNYALGSQTFAWVAATGAPAAFNSGATHVWIHCGVNDVATSRTWAAVETNLDTILAAKPEGVLLYISEILPSNSESDLNSATIRTWNGNLATWCSANGVTLISCHDELGQVRGSTGELDDLLTSYNYDGVHLTQSGVNKLAYCFAPAAPVFTTNPTISGVANHASTLTATTGTVSNEPTSTWQWKADGVAISGATSTTYVLTLDDVGKSITVTQTATNPVGTVSATSSAVGPVTDLPTTVDFDGSTGYVTGTPQNVFASGAFAVNVEIDTDSFGGYVASMNSTNVLIAFVGSGNNIAFGNGTGWAEFAKANGVWRFVHDTSLSGFARYRAFKDGVEQTQTTTSGTYVAPSPPNVALEFGRRTTGVSYFNGRLSQIKVWGRACLPSDSDQTTSLSLSLETITSTTWDDTSSNNTNYTLTGGATPAI